MGWASSARRASTQLRPLSNTVEQIVIQKGSALTPGAVHSSSRCDSALDSQGRPLWHLESGDWPSQLCIVFQENKLRSSQVRHSFLGLVCSCGLCCRGVTKRALLTVSVERM
ncbi:unnamed protein product [Lota lota]